MAPSLTAITGDRLRDALGRLSEPATIHELDETLRFLARWRSRLLANTYRVHHGEQVLGGPFAGLRYVTTATEGALIPRLLGTYESELHPHLLQFAAAGLECVIDVGCAEGYYAVGLARLLPEATVYAYDIDPRAREACAANAKANGVEDRIVIRELFEPMEFARFANRRCLVICDCEGAEDDLLLPQQCPALQRMKLIVETHDGHRPGVRQRLIDRFAPSHAIELVRQAPKPQPLPDWFDELGHLDQLLAVWEFRSGPTPWLVMTPKYDA